MAAGSTSSYSTNRNASPVESVLSAVSPVTARGRRDKASAMAQYQAIRRCIALTDAMCIMAGLLTLHLGGVEAGPLSGEFLAVLVVAPLAWVAVFHSFDLYGVDRLSAWAEFRLVIGASSIGTALIVIATFWWSPPATRQVLAVTLFVALSLELVTRRLWRWTLWRRRAEGDLSLRTLIVGDDGPGHLAAVLAQPGSGFKPVGFVCDADSAPCADGIPFVGNIGQLRQIIRACSVECLLVSSTGCSVADMAHLLQVARQENVPVKITANVPNLLTSRVGIQPIGPVLALSLKPACLTTSQALMKRSFDIVLSSAVLLAALPVMTATAIAVRLTSSGPVLFRQDRVTKDGRIFRMYKFRTMVHEGCRRGMPVAELTTPFFKEFDDPRLTRIGRLLRRRSVDELPQLWNVLRGDMSLVGPRPLPAGQIAGNETFGARHEIKAGLTGWWQINGRSCVDADEALRLDLFYIENWSMSLDIYVLLRTLGTVLTGRGAC